MNTRNDLTYSELLHLADGNTPLTLSLRWAVAATHEERLRIIEEAIDWASQELTKNRHVHKSKTEDELTIDIIGKLKCMGFAASHDTQYGGHCDIVVEAKNDFLWIAEAKIDRSYPWIFKGFQQLDTRY